MKKATRGVAFFIFINVYAEVEPSLKSSYRALFFLICV